MPIIHNNRDVTDEIQQQIAGADGSGHGTSVEKSPAGATLQSLMHIHPDINLKDLSIASPKDTLDDHESKQIGAAVPLSEVPSPTAGLRVISARGTPGRIANIRPLTDREVNIVWNDVVHGEKMILIRWENGKTSEFPHSKLEYVLVGRPRL
jgi:hypothetical protein